MLAVSYYPVISVAPFVVEYLPVMHDGYAGQKSRGQLMKMAASAGLDWNEWLKGDLPNDVWGIEDVARMLSSATPPREIEYRQDGKFFRVIKRRWERDEATA
jgi:DNA repair protein RadD